MKFATQCKPVFRSVLACAFIVQLVSVASADLVLIGHGLFISNENPRTTFFGFQDGRHQEHYNVASIPDSGTLDIRNFSPGENPAFSRLGYSYMRSGGVTDISIDFSYRWHRNFIQSDYSRRASSANFFITTFGAPASFVVTTPSIYEISSEFSASVFNAGGRTTSASHYVYLRQQNADGTDPTNLLLYDDQYTQNFQSSNENWARTFSAKGGITGMLLPGKVYQLTAGMSSFYDGLGPNLPDAFGIGSGRFTMRVTAVPEPSGLAFVGLVTLTAATTFRRSKHGARGTP